MKYAKMFGLLALAAAALMAFVGTASATTLTGEGGATLGVGAKIKAEAEAAPTLDGTINITCQKSIVEGEVTNAGGANKTVVGTVSKLTFDECGNHTVTVEQEGTLEIHHIAGTNNGTLTSNGAEVTVLTHSLFLGTRHCIYITTNTHVGTLTGSATTKSTATQDIDSSPIPQDPTDSLCGNDAEWTGKYKVTSPDSLNVDA